MISLEEKIAKQRHIVNELFFSLIDVPKNKKQYVNYFQNQIKELFKIEMDYYGIPCLQEDSTKNKIELQFIRGKKSDRFSARLLNNTRINEDGSIIRSTPKLIINTTPYFKYLFDQSYKARMKSCKMIIIDLFHEIRHLRQFAMYIEGVSNYDALKSAKESYLFNCKFLHPDFYNANHDNFTAETDADYYSFQTLEDIGIGLEYTNYNKTIVEAEREFSTIVSPFIGLLDRDVCVHAMFDSLMSLEKKYSYFLDKPILQKEYNLVGVPLRLGDLITNFKREIKSIEKSDFKDEQKKILISDTTKMYYELFIRRLVYQDNFELYEAISIHGKEVINDILSKLQSYNARQKNIKADAVRTKTTEIEKLYFEGKWKRVANRGFIANPNNDFQDAIYVREFMNKIKLGKLPCKLVFFLMSVKFLSELPLEGYYLFRDGRKVSIEDFLKKYLLPVLKETKPSNYYFAFQIVRDSYCEPAFKANAAFCYEQINKKYQTVDTKISKIASIDVLTGKSDFKSIYDWDTAHFMELAKKMADGDMAAYGQIFGGVIIEDFDLPHAQFKLEHVRRFEKMLSYAEMLTNDTIFNPEGVNYKEKLLSDLTYKKYVKEIEMQKLMHSMPEFWGAIADEKDNLKREKRTSKNYY